VVTQQLHWKQGLKEELLIKVLLKSYIKLIRVFDRDNLNKILNLKEIESLQEKEVRP
jgi:hypothetical protein